MLQRGPGHRISPALRGKIERLLGQEPTRSDRQTAKRAGVSVDTVSRIRDQLERQGALQATRSPRGPGPRQMVGPQHAGSLGIFIKAIRLAEADYIRWFHVRPAVRVSVTVSYAAMVKFTARWDEDAGAFAAADWGDADALEAVPDLALAQTLIRKADRMMLDDPEGGMATLAEGGMIFDDCPACRHRMLVARAEGV